MTSHHSDLHLLAGQRLLAGFTGTRLNDELKYLIQDLKVGGVILFAPNVETPGQVRELCTSIQSFARHQGLPPLFLAIDQEGGTVARLKSPCFREFDGMPAISDGTSAQVFGREMATLLFHLGLNMNFAPVLDCEPPGFKGVMHQRVLRGSPKTVARRGAHIIRALQQKGIMAVAKHFPGIGRTTLDSHLHRPFLDIAPDTLEKSDLVPFKAAISEGVAGIMLSHIVYPRLDWQWPASLSSVITRSLLREQLGYKGLVMTDDLDMKAINEDIHLVVQRILKAEIDLFLICHTGPDIPAAVHEARRCLSRDPQLRERSTAAFHRIMAAKKGLGHRHQGKI